MKVLSVKIDRWRNIESISFDVPPDARVVCLIGANGTGKSHILELLASCAHHLGFSPGIQITRGNPFNDEHSFEIKVFLPKGLSENLDKQFGDTDCYSNWDRTLTLKSSKPGTIQIIAGGIGDETKHVNFGNQVVNQLRQSKEIHHLFLDSDRAYSEASIHPNLMGQILEAKWRDKTQEKNRSIQRTKTLYDDWIKAFVAIETQTSTERSKQCREAKEKGETQPDYIDYFDSYKKALLQVLPHLNFRGVDTKIRTIVFETSGVELTFDKLSGGEKEIAFLVGQVDRFQLRRGLFLLDEPELHLNNDLLKRWISFLDKSIVLGQIWLATHSLEAVEATGIDSTILLERDETNKKVVKANSLSGKKVYTALARAVGSPAFSISNLKFIMIEGEDIVGERERFRKVCNEPDDVRFLACGPCSEVMRRITSIRSIAKESVQEIHVGGVIDRDWRTKKDIETLEKDFGLYCLKVHEIENFFLHPQTVKKLMAQHDLDQNKYLEIIQNASDKRIGYWILQTASALSGLPEGGDVGSAAHTKAFDLTRAQLNKDLDAALKELVKRISFSKEQQEKYLNALKASFKMYERKRKEESFWKIIEGKEILRATASEFGFSDTATMERAAFVLWGNDRKLVPEGVKSLRRYIQQI